jgi:hypothetical protein
MDDLQTIREGMKKLRLRDLEQVEKATKIPLDTLIKIYYGITKYPRFPTIKKLAAHFGRLAA